MKDKDYMAVELLSAVRIASYIVDEMYHSDKEILNKIDEIKGELARLSFKLDSYIEIDP